MNLRKFYIKSGLLLIQMLLSVNFIFSQEYILTLNDEFKKEKKIKKYKSYKNLILGIEDTLFLIKKQGYFQAKVDQFIKKDSFNYEVKLSKNQKVKFVKIINKSDFGEDILMIFDNYTLINDLIKYDEIEFVVKEIIEILSKKGYPFAKVSFKNHKLLNPSTINLDLEINYGSKRQIDKVIVKGYENFPKKFIKKIFNPVKNKSLNVDKALIQSNDINKIGFARNTRDPELLFTKDSTFLYLYIEKIKRNSIDGFVSFYSDESSGKINIEGHANISLINTFNKGENINFNFRSQKNQDRSLNSDIYVPYIFGSPLNIKFGLNVVQKDSIFSSNENLIDVDVDVRNIKMGLGFKTNKSSSETEIENIENFDSKLFSFFSEYQIIDYEDKLIPGLFKFYFRFGSGKKNQLGYKTNYSKYSIELSKKFNFSSKLNLSSQIIKEEINSKNLVINELLRFGGAESIRGFDDNSIFTNSYTLLKTSVNYYLNDTIYIYTIFDVANYKNNLFNIDNDIYSGGFGFSNLTKNGSISVNYSKGNLWGNSFNLKNAKINVTFLTFF